MFLLNKGRIFTRPKKIQNLAQRSTGDTKAVPIKDLLYGRNQDVDFKNSRQKKIIQDDVLIGSAMSNKFIVPFPFVEFLTCEFFLA